MKYSVGDKVRVRGDLEIDKEYGNDFFVDEMEKYKGKVAEIEKEACSGYMLEHFEYHWTPEMLRPAEYKIWCETEEEKQAVLEELEKEGYVWYGNEEKPTNKKDDEFCFYSQMALYVTNSHIKWNNNRSDFESEHCIELTPSEFTGIDFSEKIIIAKTPTGATATYGDKTVTIEGKFDEDDESGDYDMTFKTLELLEPYVEPSYNAKLFCIVGSVPFDKGRIYEIKNGMFTFGYLVQRKPFENLDDVNNYFSAQFMEVKEN